MSSAPPRSSSSTDSHAPVAPVDVTITIFPGGYTEPHGDEQAPATWQDFAEALRTVVAEYDRAALKSKAGKLVKPKDAPGFSPAVYVDGYKTRPTLIAAYALGLDVDQLTTTTVDTIRDAFPGIASVMYTSMNHTADRPKFRVFLGLSRPVDADEYDALWRSACTKLPGAVDTGAPDASRFWYPRLQIAGEPMIFETTDGAGLDVDAILAETTPTKARPAKLRLAAPLDHGDGCIHEGEDGYEEAIEHARQLCRTHPKSLRATSPDRTEADKDGQIVLMMLMGDLRWTCELAVDDAIRVHGEEYAPRHLPGDQWTDETEVRRKYDEARRGGRVALRSPMRQIGKPRNDTDAIGKVIGKPDLAMVGALVAKKAAAPEKFPRQTFKSNSDTEIVRALAAFYLDHQVVRTRGGWHAYDVTTGTWRDADRRIHDDLMWLDKCNTTDAASKVSPLVMSATRRNGLESLLIKECDVPSFFDAAREDFPAGAKPGFALRDGFVTFDDAGKVTVVPHSPDHRAREFFDVDHDANAASDVLDAYLMSLFDGDADAAAKVDACAEFFGAALMGIGPTYGRAILFKGYGNDGKSTLANVVAAVFPTAWKSNTSPAQLAERFGLTNLPGVRLNIDLDVGENEFRDQPQVFKKAVVGDPLDCERKGKDPIPFRPEASHLFCTNNDLATRDYSDGFFRRWLVIMFNRRFTADEVILDLEAKLRSQKPAIIAWILRGASRLLANGGYTLPPSHHEAMAEWRNTANPVATFVADRCALETDEAKWQSGADLYRKYTEWADEEGVRNVTTATGFGKLLKKQVPWKRSNGTKFGMRVVVQTLRYPRSA